MKAQKTSAAEWPKFGGLAEDGDLPHGLNFPPGCEFLGVLLP